MVSEPLKVAVVYPHLPHYRFGVFQQMVADERLDVTFLSDEREHSGTIETIPQSWLPTVPVHNRYFGGILWQRGVYSALRQLRPQAVIFLGDVSHGSTWVAAAWLRVRRIPVLFWTIGWHRPERGIRRVVRTTFYRLANTLLLYGHWAEEIGSRLGYPAERMVRVGNSRTSSMAAAPLTASDRAELLRRLENLAANVVVSVVRLNASKRLDLLMDAAAELVQRGTPVTLLVVGVGPERQNLQSQAAALNVDARFLGALYAEEALQIVYEAADITVLPSAAGLTVTQSLEYGTPVITHDDPHRQMPEAEAVRAGVTGDLYREGDPHDLARVMRSWFGGRARADEVAEACVREVETRWSPQAQVESIKYALGIEQT